VMWNCFSFVTNSLSLHERLEGIWGKSAASPASTLEVPR
jgi:hypothetical protein